MICIPHHDNQETLGPRDLNENVLIIPMERIQGSHLYRSNVVVLKSHVSACSNYVTNKTVRPWNKNE